MIVVECLRYVPEEVGEACYRQGWLEAECVLEDAVQGVRKAVYGDHIVAAFEDLIVRGHTEKIRMRAIAGNCQSVEWKCPCLACRREVADEE